MVISINTLKYVYFSSARGWYIYHCEMSSLSLVTFFALKSSWSAINQATPYFILSFNVNMAYIFHAFTFNLFILLYLN